jgi:predicted PurR-regulated permease PerM
VPFWLINILVIVIMLGLFLCLGSIIFISVNSFIEEFPKYEVKFQEMVQDTFHLFNIRMEDFRSFFENRVNWVEIYDRLSLAKVITGSMGFFFDFISKLLLTTIFLLFLLAEHYSLNERLKKVLSERDIQIHQDTLRDIEHSVRKYILNKTIISVITGMISILWLMIFKVDFAIISGVLIFLLNYIPNFGSIVATSFPILVCIFQYGFSWTLIVVSSLLIMTQMMMGNVLEPRLMGYQLRMSPLVILISLIFWYWVWGAIGMVLAVPLTSTLNIILKQFDSMKVVSAMMATERKLRVKKKKREQ